MKFKKDLVAALGISLLLFACEVIASPMTSDQAKKILEISGFTETLAQMPEGIKAGIQEASASNKGVPQEFYDGVTRIMVDAFNPALLIGPIRNEVTSNLTKEDGEKLLKWFESEKGKRITAAEAKMNSMDAITEMQQQAQKLLANEKLVNYARRVDKAIQGTEMMVELQEKTALSVFTALVGGTAPDADKIISDFKAQIAAGRQQTYQAAQQFSILASAYAYQDVDDTLMIEYITFLEKPYTMKLYQSVVEGLNLAVDNSISAMQSAIKSFVDEMQKEVAR